MNNQNNTSTGEPVNQAPGTSETTAEISTAATDTSETPAEIISTTPATTPAPAASEAVSATINATSTGEPVNQAPTPTASGTTTPAPAPTAPENTDKAETQVTTSPDLRSAAVDARRQRVVELKKSLTSGSGSVATPTPGATEATPATSKTSPATASPGTLPADYLTGGYRKGEGKESYPNPALVDHAEIIGKALAAAGVTPTAFNRMVRALKGAEKLPYEAQQGALKKLVPLVLKEKNAPPLLREIVERHREAVHSPADFAACLEHFRDIAIFLEANVTKK